MKGLFLILVILFSSVSFAQEYGTYVELVEITLPPNLDDHGKFGLASPNFEFIFKLNVGEFDYEKEFVVPANKSKLMVTHKLSGIKFYVSGAAAKTAELYYPFMNYTIEEEEWIGTDNIFEGNLHSAFFDDEFKKEKVITVNGIECRGFEFASPCPKLYAKIKITRR